MPRPFHRAGGCLIAAVLLAACAAPPPPTPTPPPAPTAALAPTVTLTALPRLTPTPAPIPTVTPAPVATRAPATATGTPVELRRTLAALEALDSYRLLGRLDSRESSPVDLTVEYVRPDRRRVVLGDLEIITIGASTYVRQGGPWTKLQGAAGASLAPDVRDIAGEFEQAAFTPQGQETLDGEPCVVFGYTETEQRGRLWVSTRDQLLRKIEGEGPAGAYTLRFTDLNRPIAIVAPI
ncbi:MAG: hypothetical protein IT340_00470 [Chloroflexi bacterium]|nr:hypothetical protein [Chloroflexota bacterium]